MEKYLFEFLEQYMPLSAEEKKEIVDLNVFRSFKKGAVLLKEGDTIKGGHFVVKGCLRSYYMVDGEEKTTGFYTETETISPVPGGDKSVSAHFVSCVEDSIVTVANSGTDTASIDNHPRFRQLCSMISEQLLTNSLASFAEFKNSSPEQRYLNLLETRPDLLQRVPQYQIASYLGMTPQSLSRIRKRIARKTFS